MSEITQDYYNDANVQRWLVKAKAAQLSGSGSKTAYPWVITHDELPDELIDSDEATSDSSGAPTLRASTDVLGSNQIGLDVKEFVPASGGASGGATAEIYLNVATADHDSDVNVYLWWNKSGKTQPAADAQYGSESVYSSVHATNNVNEDFTDSTSNDNDGTGTGMSTTTDIPYGALEAYEFNAGTDRIAISDDASLDITDSLTVYLWFECDSDTGTFQGILSKRQSFTSVNYSLAFDIGTDTVDWNYRDGSGFQGVDGGTVAWSTNFGLNTWYFIAGTMEDTGSDVVVKLYKSGVELGSVTVSSSSMIANNDSLILGNIDQSSFGFPLDGRIKNVNIINAVLDSDDLTTIYNNQSDPSTFWDTTEAVEAGPFSAEDNPKYQWTFHGRKRTWTVQLFEDGFTDSVTHLCAGAEMRGTWGYNTGNFDERIRASELFLEVIDPSLALYNTLIDSSKEESDFLLKLTDSTGAYTLRMRPRLDEVSTLLVEGLEQNVTSIYAYCTMAEMDNIDAITLSSSTLSNLFRLIMVSSGISQDIEFYLAHSAENAYASSPMLDVHRLNRLDLIFAEEGRKVDSMQEQLRSLLEGFGAVAINGMDGRWHIKHEYSLGESKTGDDAAQVYETATGAVATTDISASPYTATIQTLERNTLKRPVKPVQAVQVVRGNSRDFITVDMVKHGDFENGWLSSSSHEVWEAVSGAYEQSTNADTGTYAFKQPSGSNRSDQTLLRAAGGGQDLDIEVTCRYAFESDTASTTKIGGHTLLLFYSNPSTVDSKRGDGGSGWDNINGAIDLDGGIVANGASLVYATLLTTIYGPLPDFDGDFKIAINGLLTNYAAYIDTLEVRIKKGDEATSSFKAVTGRYDLNGNLIGKGTVVEQKVPWYNGVLGLDDNDNGTRDSVNEMIQVQTTASGSWVQASQFQTTIEGFTGTSYDDLFNLIGNIRITRQDRSLEQVEGRVYDIVPHEQPIHYSSKTYLQQYTDIDFKREVTAFVANEKRGIASVAIEPVTLYIGRDTTIRTASFASLPTTSSLIATLDSGRDLYAIDVDEDEGYIFTDERVVATLTTRYLTRRNLSGGGKTDLVSYNSGGGSGIFKLALGRANKYVYVGIQVYPGPYSGFSIVRYDYAGNFVDTLVTNLDGRVTSMCVDDSERYLFYRENKTGGGAYDRIKRYEIATGGTTTLISSGLWAANNINKMECDQFAEFFFERNLSEVRRIGYPSGASGTAVVSAGTAETALAIDKKNSKIYYVKSGGVIYRSNQDGTTEESMVNDGAVTVVDISLGY